MIPAFAGKRLLIVEDGFFLDSETRAVLEQSDTRLTVLSGELIGRILERKGVFDAAILDINLDAELAFAIVEQLEWLGVPYIFALTAPAEGPRGNSAYRLCKEIDELKAIAAGLFGNSSLH